MSNEVLYIKRFWTRGQTGIEIYLKIFTSKKGKPVMLSLAYSGPGTASER